MAGRICIAEVEEIVPVGSIDPDQVHMPDVFVHRVIQSKNSEKRIEFRTTTGGGPGSDPLGKGEMKEKRERIIKRAAKEIQDGMYVNLGIGIPTLCANNL